jgi:hypothetical protein
MSSHANAALPLAMQTPLDADDALFFLTRTGFSPPPGDVARLVGMTRAQVVADALGNARREPVTAWPDWIADPPPSRAERQAMTPDARRDAQRMHNQRYDALRAAWVNEMVATPSPLTERMTLFWHGHFTSGQDKVPFPQTMAAQHTLLRREALGNFGTLLHAMAKDPAMLQYLDGASNRKGRPNENFAREVMELFTLGEGHYTQRDVTEAARALTGWSVDPDTLRFAVRPDWHDTGDKTVLGVTGPLDGDGFLDILLQRPETARFIAGKLWREFVSDAPDPAELETVATRFRASGYEIRRARRALVERRVLGCAQSRRADQVAGGVRGRFGEAVRRRLRRSADAREHGARARTKPVLSAERQRLAGRPDVDQQRDAACAQAIRRATFPRDRIGRHAPGDGGDAGEAGEVGARRLALRSRALARAIPRAAAGDRGPVDRAPAAACGAAGAARRGDRHGIDRQRVSRSTADGPGLSIEMTTNRYAGAAHAPLAAKDAR